MSPAVTAATRDQARQLRGRYSKKLAGGGICMGRLSFFWAAAFRRIFERATGISPLQYRQRFRSVAAA